MRSILVNTLHSIVGKQVEVQVSFSDHISGATIPAKYTGEVTEIVNGPAKALIVLDGRTIINLDYVQIIELLD